MLNSQSHMTTLTPRSSVIQDGSYPRYSHSTGTEGNEDASPLNRNTINEKYDSSNEADLPQAPDGTHTRSAHLWVPERRQARDEEIGIVRGMGMGTEGVKQGGTQQMRSNTVEMAGGRKPPNFIGRLFDRVFKFSENDPFGPRPRLTTYIKMYWGDWFTLFLLGMLALGLLKWSPMPKKKYFALVFNDTGELINPEYSYPRQVQHISIFADAAIAVLTPIIVSLIVNICTVHSFWDLNNATLGVAYSVMTACIIQIIVKLVAVGLRPYFLTACNPILPPIKPGVGYQKLYFTIDICTEPNPKILATAMQSFPSGHSAAAWAGLFYLSLYLNGKLKPFANYHAAWWKMLAFLAPMVASLLIVGSLTLDNSHHWYDIVAGSILGVLAAILSYRMTYASVWDWRWNHIPLPRGNVTDFHKGGKGGHWDYQKREGQGLVYAMEEIDQWQSYVATSRGGWKPYSRGPVWRGAPGDMAASGAFFRPGL